VEPVPEHFKTLQNTYDDRPLVQCAKVAVSDKTGRASMYVIPDEAADDPRYPGWAPAASSLYKTRTALHWPDIAPLVQDITVETLTLSTLISAYNITDIDVFQIDAEGADYMILRQLDFEQFKPLVINLEIVNLPSGEQAKTRALLDKQGYIYQKTGYDLVALRKDRLSLFPSLAL
jgi:FkbM family methyltransferase